MQTDGSSDPSADAFFASTLRYIQFQKQKGGAMGEKYDPIKIWWQCILCDSLVRSAM